MKILTELVFENVLSSLEPEEIAAVLSALIFQVWLRVGRGAIFI